MAKLSFHFLVYLVMKSRELVYSFWLWRTIIGEMYPKTDSINSKTFHRRMDFEYFWSLSERGFGTSQPFLTFREQQDMTAGTRWETSRWKVSFLSLKPNLQAQTTFFHFQELITKSWRACGQKVCITLPAHVSDLKWKRKKKPLVIGQKDGYLWFLMIRHKEM